MIIGMTCCFLVLWGCASSGKIFQNPSQQYYRIRKCYDVGCDQLTRYGPTAFRTPIYRAWELCSKKDCEMLEEYGPNETPGLSNLKIMLQENIMLTDQKFK